MPERAPRGCARFCVGCAGDRGGPIGVLRLVGEKVGKSTTLSFSLCALTRICYYPDQNPHRFSTSDNHQHSKPVDIVCWDVPKPQNHTTAGTTEGICHFTMRPKGPVQVYMDTRGGDRVLIPQDVHKRQGDAAQTVRVRRCTVN